MASCPLREAAEQGAGRQGARLPTVRNTRQHPPNIVLLGGRIVPTPHVRAICQVRQVASAAWCRLKYILKFVSSRWTIRGPSIAPADAVTGASRQARPHPCASARQADQWVVTSTQQRCCSLASPCVHDCKMQPSPGSQQVRTGAGIPAAGTHAAAPTGTQKQDGA